MSHLGRATTLEDFRNISTISIFLLAVAPYNFWNLYTYQNDVNILFLVVKSIEVTLGFTLRFMKKIARWRYHWNIWCLRVKTKISPLVVRYPGSNGYQKNQQDLRNLDLEAYCTNIQPKLKKLWSFTKNQSFAMASGGFLEKEGNKCTTVCT